MVFPASAGMIRGRFWAYDNYIGVPASAGMILPGLGEVVSADGVPRIRGDDPTTVFTGLTAGRCSPHPRG